MHEALEWFSLRRSGSKDDESIIYQPSALRLLTYLSESVEKGGFDVPGLLLGKSVIPAGQLHVAVLPAVSS